MIWNTRTWDATAVRSTRRTSTSLPPTVCDSLRSITRGDVDWKLVTLNATDDTAWELYDLSGVRTETQNVGPQHRDRVNKMKTEWTAWAKQANVLPWPKDR